jgi:hypothetical protein
MRSRRVARAIATRRSTAPSIPLDEHPRVDEDDQVELELLPPFREGSVGA